MDHGQGRVDPTVVITHVLPLADAPHASHIFARREEGCLKVLLKPQLSASSQEVRARLDPQARPLRHQDVTVGVRQ